MRRESYVVMFVMKSLPQFCIHRSNTQTLVNLWKFLLVVECIKNEKQQIWQYIFHILILLGLLFILRLLVGFFFFFLIIIIVQRLTAVK